MPMTSGIVGRVFGARAPPAASAYRIMFAVPRPSKGRVGVSIGREKMNGHT